MSEKILHNWSETKISTIPNYYQPNNVNELKQLIQSNQGKKIRICGSNMSPNGISFSDCEIGIDMGKFNKILSICPDKKLVTCQAGVKIETLLQELEKHKLTLHNLPCTILMQMGGLIQTSAHGTGIRLTPLNDAVKSLKLVKANGEEVELQSGSVLDAAACSLGTFGAIYEMTLQCVDLYFLRLNLQVLDVDSLQSNHAQRLDNYKQVKQHYIPYTGKVVVYNYEEISEEQYQIEKENNIKSDETIIKRKMELLKLDHELIKDGSNFDNYLKNNSKLTFSQLRGRILAHDPLNTDLIKKLNNAELDYWTNSQGITVDVNHRMLMFECGGKQHVKEFTFEITEPNMDLNFVRDILKIIEEYSIPAPAPIEQRWCAGSRGLLSPNYKNVPNPQEIPFGWAGIIMYLTPDKELNKIVTEKFMDYYYKVVNNLGEKYKLSEHLAKVETTEQNKDAIAKRFQRWKDTYEKFESIRTTFDPENIFINKNVAQILYNDF